MPTPGDQVLIMAYRAPVEHRDELNIRGQFDLVVLSDGKVFLSEYYVNEHGSWTGPVEEFEDWIRSISEAVVPRRQLPPA